MLMIATIHSAECPNMLIASHYCSNDSVINKFNSYIYVDLFEKKKLSKSHTELSEKKSTHPYKLI